MAAEIIDGKAIAAKVRDEVRREVETMGRKPGLATILVAPLMSCSARLPVYTLLIAACIPNQRVLGSRSEG